MPRLLFTAIAFLSLVSAGRAQTRVRVGAFPNITHAQALVGKANGWFERAMGANAKIEWKSFNAGPSAIEALYAGALDLTYIGPNPAISGYVRSNGEALRVIAGATSGGAALVIRKDSGIRSPADFHGKRVATPQLGNTQDLALRAWLAAHGLQTREKGGDVQVIPMANPDQLTLFLKKQLDAAWSPEPWATRLVREGDGQLFLDERSLWPNGQFTTAVLVARTGFLIAHPELVKNWIRAHVELTNWINSNLAEAKALLNSQIQKEVGRGLPADVVDESFTRLHATWDPLRTTVMIMAHRSYEAGFLGRNMPDLLQLYDLSLLNQVLTETRKRPVQ